MPENEPQPSDAPRADPQADHRAGRRRAWTAPRTLARVAVAAAGVGAFFLAAESINPHRSSAAPTLPSAPSADTDDAAGAVPKHVQSRSLGRYQGKDHAVHIIATPEGPRYTITDALGNILEIKLHEDELRSALEAHGIEIGAPADNAPSIMMADQPALDGLLD